MRRITAPLGATLAAAALALAAGCGAGAPGVDDATGHTAGAGPATTSVAPTEGTGDGAGAPATVATSTAQVARTDRALPVFGTSGAAEPTTVLPATTGFGSPRALRVVAEADGWLEVALPVRPNGSTGWVRRADVELRAVDESIVIDLDRRTLTLYDGGTEVLTTPVAVGSSGNPTPTGEYYVVDKLDTGDPAGPYGRFALGLSAFSDVLTEFAGGDGQVGIHGTNDPSSIGRAVSHGCIRVPGDVAERLNAAINLGTPVVISA